MGILPLSQIACTSWTKTQHLSPAVACCAPASGSGSSSCWVLWYHSLRCSALIWEVPALSPLVSSKMTSPDLAIGWPIIPNTEYAIVNMDGKARRLATPIKVNPLPIKVNLLGSLSFHTLEKQSCLHLGSFPVPALRIVKRLVHNSPHQHVGYELVCVGCPSFSVCTECQRDGTLHLSGFASVELSGLVEWLVL